MNNRKTPRIRFKGFTDDWEQRKVGDHCDMFNGDRSSKYPNTQDMVSDGVPFINAGDLEDGHVNLVNCNRITREKYDDLGGAKLQLGDIVYCLRGTLGKNSYIDNFNEGTVASSLVALRPKNIDGRYLFHVLNSDIEYKQRIVHDEGAAQPNLSAKSVSGFVIPIPDIDEQKKISKFLDGLNNLITLHQRKLEKLKIVKKAMLENCFPKNGEKVPKFRFSGFTGDWEQRKLGEILSERINKTSDFESNPLYSLTIENGVTPKTERYERDFLVRKSEDLFKIVNPNEFVTNPMNLRFGALGYNKNAFKVSVSGYYDVFSIDNNECSSFWKSYFNTSASLRYFDNVATGTLIEKRRVKYSTLREMEFYKPLTIDEKKKIGMYCESLDHLITLHQRKLEKLKIIKKSFLEKMFV